MSGVQQAVYKNMRSFSAAGETCWGVWDTPSTVTRMSYTYTELPTSQSPACNSQINGENDALSFYQTALLNVSVILTASTKLSLTLSVTGSPPYSKTISINSTTVLSAAGSYSETLGSGTHTISFAVNPNGMSQLAADQITMTAKLESP